MKNENYILPRDIRLSNSSVNQKILLIMHLHYEDTVDYFLDYLNGVLQEIDSIVTTSKECIRDRVIWYMKKNNRNCKVILKDNRGRDISSLLVTCRKEIPDYQYLCFLHDKKEKDILTKPDTDIWIQCLWENMISSQEYIHNILWTFQENPKLGLLLPPHTISENFPFFFRDTWGKNFERTQKLANDMNLNCELNRKERPVSCGTVLWCRVDALLKLFSVNWKYENFDEEPLKSDATISHAIERIFPYVAWDAGYDTGIVMTDSFAGRRLSYLQEIMIESFDRMEQSLGIRNLYTLHQYENIQSLVQQSENIYIYGAGSNGKKCHTAIKSMGAEVTAFLVTKLNGGRGRKEMGVPVIPFDDFIADELSCIVLSVSGKESEKIIQMIRERYPGYKKVCRYCL